MRPSLLSLLVLGLQLGRAVSVCTLPPDLWCESAEIALECTGSLDYCNNYVRNQKERPFKVQLAFEAACPDSRGFIQRIHPRLLTQPFVYDHVDFEPVPWGLSKPDPVETVKCHHGPRECVGNRLLTCLMGHFDTDISFRDNSLHCFMSKMEDKTSDPVENLRECFYQTGHGFHFGQILDCANGTEATQRQKIDELKTQSILSVPRFVPYISINGKSHLHLQSAQIMLPEKVRAWSRTLESFPLSPMAPSQSSCQLPPDYWCSSPDITAQCFNQAGCDRYASAVNNRPLHIQVLYRPTDLGARRYLLNYIKKQFLTDDNLAKANNTGKVVLELQPVLNSLVQCKSSSCAEEALHECIMGKLPVTERNQLLTCLIQHGPRASVAFQNECTHLVTAQQRSAISQCTRSADWFRLSVQRSNQLKKHADFFNRDYFVVVNDYGLEAAQGFAHDIHKLICFWFKGAGHDRDNCYRCEIEPTHCM